MPACTLPPCFMAVAHACEQQNPKEPSEKNWKEKGCEQWNTKASDMVSNIVAVTRRKAWVGKGCDTGKAAKIPDVVRAEREKDLQEVVRRYVAVCGGSINGAMVSSEIASEFNQWIRTNSKRND